MSSEERKSFEQLCEEKASCLEFAMNGYIRMYEEGEKRCECKDCQRLDIVNQAYEQMLLNPPWIVNLKQIDS